MNEKELRIGNYVNGIYLDDEDNEQKTLCEVVGLDSVGFSEYTIWVDSEASKEYFNRFEPIPITEDWLVKFGFKIEKIDGYYYSTKDKFYPIYKRGKFYGFNGLGLNVKDFEYVHQLQNLYFALTGKELTFKSDIS